MTQPPPMDKPVTQSRTYLGAALLLLWLAGTVALRVRGLPDLPAEFLVIPAALMGVGIRDAISRNTIETREAKQAAQVAAQVAVSPTDPRGAAIEAVPDALPLTHPAHTLRD
ncbi:MULTISPECIES: hypothetical protein [Deinococcus]|uniref:Uncharacterized protein n=1 Tax=Deinococcus rufus TaxID=2136097 RepID=A0ABV7ZCP4_9DEIO|nr:hypothetical protein [Deinococcus sp. AB2017081]WQE94022.1 hypothetical protein U2P90_11445 [Deinococcus sp. AB2017081]